MAAIFFATDKDLLQIVGWLLEVPGMTVLEPASRPDHPNRWFKSVEEVSQYFEEPGRHFSAWLQSTGAKPLPRWTEFNPDAQRRSGAKGRTFLESPALIGIGRNNDQNGCLANASISCWTEKGARQRSVWSPAVLDEVDWRGLQSAAGRLNRQLSKAAPAKLRS